MSNDWNNPDMPPDSRWQPPRPTPDKDPQSSADDSARDALFAQLGDQFNVRQVPPPPASQPVESPLPPRGHSDIGRFQTQLFEATPRTYITFLIVAANMAVFAAMTFDCGELFSPNIQTLIKWGSNAGPWTLSGQWWRLVTCMFVHVGIVHVALNMWVLWSLGHLVERLVGNVGFLLMYFVSGIAGSLASVLWNPGVVSAGASGAVFGVFGALMGFILLRRDCVPKEIFVNLRNSGGMFLVYNLLFGMSVPGIDMAAHLGGLGAGAVCGVLMSQPLERVTMARRAVRNLLTTVVAAGALAGVGYFYVLPLSKCVIAWQAFSDARDEAIETQRNVLQAYTLGKMDEAQFVDAVNNDVVLPWREACERVAELGPLAERIQAKPALWLQYADSQQRAWILFATAIHEHDKEMRQYLEQVMETERLLKEITSGR